MKKIKFNNGKGTLLEKIEDQLVDILVDITVMASFLFIIMR